MSLKIEVESPKTQSTDAVKALLAFKKVASDPLPQEVSLDGGRLVLVLSNKKDAFYTVTARACSCPAAAYHPGTRCKHQKRYFPLCDDVFERAMSVPFRPYDDTISRLQTQPARVI
jgi:hypothetical protein